MYAPHVLSPARDYDALYRSFRWQVPARYNIGVDVCDRWATREPGRTAIFNLGADGAVEEIGYGALRERSNRLANVLAARGIGRGDRRSPSVTSPSTSLARSRCRWRCCSASRRSPIGWRTPAPAR
jgi:hypothetical protein